MDRIKNREPITAAEFRLLVSKTDWKQYEKRVFWHLSEPKCICDSCYENWLAWGSKLYQNEPEQFVDEKNQAFMRLRDRRITRNLYHEIQDCYSV